MMKRSERPRDERVLALTPLKIRVAAVLWVAQLLQNIHFPKRPQNAPEKPGPKILQFILCLEIKGRRAALKKKKKVSTWNIAHFPTIMSSKGFNSLIIEILTLVCTRQRVKQPLQLIFFKFDCYISVISLSQFNIAPSIIVIYLFIFFFAISLISSYAQVERSPGSSRLLSMSASVMQK